jgi:type VI secretion system protein ImpC
MGSRDSLEIGVVGDFSAAAESAARRRLHVIDRDDFDDVLARIAPRLELGLAYCHSISLSRFEDFHPDSLATRVPALSKLLDARDEVGNLSLMRRLIEDSGVDLAAVQAGAETESDGKGGARSSEGPSAPQVTSEGDLLDAIVSGRKIEGPIRVARATLDPAFERVVSEIAEASADRTDYAAQERWRAAIDAEIAARMSAILSHPAFLALESSWRSLRSLVFGIDTSESLRIRILDLSAAELLGELSGERSPTLDRILVQQERDTPGGVALDLLVADYAIGDGEEDRARLAALADLAVRAAAPVVAGLHPSLWGSGEIDWEALERIASAGRGLPGAARLGLIGPRLLLRPPYGPNTEPIDRFEFDEAGGEGAAPGYVWGNAAYLVAFAAGEACATVGDASEMARFSRLEDLPIHVHREDGATVATGPTDQLLSDSEIDRVRDLGLMPLVGFRGQDTAFVGAFRSLTGNALLD